LRCGSVSFAIGDALALLAAAGANAGDPMEVPVGVTAAGLTCAGLTVAGLTGWAAAADVVAGFGAGFGVTGDVIVLALCTAVAVEESFDPPVAVLLGTFVAWLTTGVTVVGVLTGTTAVGVLTGSTGVSSAEARGAVTRNSTHAPAHIRTTFRPSQACVCGATVRIVSHPVRPPGRPASLSRGYRPSIIR
jgi:hypothetical protein